MKKKTLIAIVALLAVGQGAWADETPSLALTYEDGCYLITSTADLNNLATYVNAGNDCKGLTFKLENDIAFGESDSFSPIGMGNEEEEGNPFKGTFKGFNHTISGIRYSNKDGVGIGLFGNIAYPAVITDVVLDDCQFTGNYQVGAVVGATTGSSENEWGIFNCTVNSTVTVTATSTTVNGDELPGTYVGGIVGFCGGLIVKNCISSAIVKGDDVVGGIAGYFLGRKVETGVIENCFYTGNSVSGKDGAKEVGTIVGGRGPLEEEEMTIGTIKFTLLDNDSEAAVKNATRIANYNGLVANVTLSGRKLWKDGSWNTLCLPFGVTLSGSILDGDNVKAMRLDTSTSSYEMSTRTLTLNFENEETTLAAGTPYIIKWDNTGSSLDDPTFSNVTVSSTAAGTASTSDGKATFKGCYAPVGLAANDNTKLYLAADNTLYYPSAAMNINSFRAYFQLNGLTAGSKEAPARIALNFNDDYDETTGIATALPTRSGVGQEYFFTLDGRKVCGQPSARGIYINNGKKIIIK